MDHAQVLVRTVARAFYETDHVVVIDALVTHSALSAADISLAMHFSQSSSNKVVQRLVGKLREGGLVSVFTRQETRDGASKPSPKDYYYIDYRRAVDATKFRLHTVHERIRAATSSSGQEEKKEYICPRCRSEYTAIDVLDSLDPEGLGTGFLCKRCGSPLNELGEDAVQQDDTTALFNKQFGPILRILQKIDETTVPEITGEQAMADMRPMPRTELNPAPRTQVVSVAASRPTAVKGLSSGLEKIEVAITSESESTAAQQAAEAERKAKIAAQNQLPVWHEKSTVSGESISRPSAAAATAASGSVTANGEDKSEEKKDTSVDLEDYFKLLAQEQQEQRMTAAKEEEEDDEDDEDDEDEDDFEDVQGLPGTGISTPGFPAAGSTGGGHVNGQIPSVKVDAPDATESSPPVSSTVDLTTETAAVATPGESDEDEDDFVDVPVAKSSTAVSSSSDSLAGSKRAIGEVEESDRAAKKSKFEGSPNLPMRTIDGAADESDDDEGDFEDVA